MILVLNCGSQSVKWKVFDLPRSKAGEKLRIVKEGSGLDINEELGKIKDCKIDLIGHRVVHNGGILESPLKITAQNLAELEKLNYLAPLHNPYNIAGIKACQQVFGDVPNFAVFDTEFFKDLPDFACTYALPANLKFKKYGFHGTSHEYVAHEAAKKLKKDFNKLKIITAHLGGGCSITAIKNGKAVDTSMGFTPMQGLVMMTRSGDIDAGVVLKIAKEFGPEKAEEILNKESGLKGICGESDFLTILQKMKTDKKAKLAFDVFVYSIKKYIGAYFAVLGGCDALVFTGAIGAGNPKTRNAVCKDLDILKKTKVLAIKTNEELAIAKKISKL